jgi:hypothetical protein
MEIAAVFWRETGPEVMTLDEVKVQAAKTLGTLS